MPRHNPYSVKVELVRGCTQRCPFCSLPSMPWVDSPWEYMPEPRFRAMIDQLADWMPNGVRIEFEGRGEPSFHPKLIELISYARGRYPKCQMLMTSNGDTVRRKMLKYNAWIHELLDSGLNIVMLDCYTAERYTDFLERFPEAKRYFEDNIHPYTRRRPNYKEIILMNAVPGNTSRIRHYHNQGGTVNVEDARKAGFDIQTAPEPISRMCVRPFREMVIWSDGAMPICCNDWLPANTIGTFPESITLKDYWKKMDIVRRPLLKKDRGAVKPCNICAERAGMRVGLEMAWFSK